ncbi:endolytic transglycosylase MltG [Lacticaseibacillus hulanensis]|uniref:endolytic transglycosylase MltG n=1 Tax=Lacticaseibacillus hulanensis TaxID=2493111 RepID=UPI000FD83F7A|nr:endolytic transglycosylase MltG [Lacticaseibacillus hulanensis]
MADNKNDASGQDKRSVRELQSAVTKRIVWWIVGIILTLIVVIVFMGFRYVKSAMGPANPDSKAQVTVTIPVGSTNKQIAAILADKKVIKSAMVFNYYIKSHNLTGFQAGEYTLKPSMTLAAVIDTMRTDTVNAKPVAHVLVREGVTISDIAKSMKDYTKKDPNLTRKSFMKAIKSEKLFKQLLKKYPKLLTDTSKAKGVRYRLEGYLFPATYDVSKNMSAEQLVSEMVAKTDTTLSPYYKTMDDKNLSVQETMTLASLVEREGVTATSRRKIAGVFYNRIAINMPLQSDVAIMYALNTHKTHLTLDDLKVKSPYNLYKHPGFGPGPFNQPSLASVQATLNPADRDKDYLYFVANLKTGKIRFARTLSEHNVNKAAIGSDNQ